MACNIHNSHDHKHSSTCGHLTIEHGDHTDYLHDSHLHRVHGDHVDECNLDASSTNKAECTPDHKCEGHDKDHKHGTGCGHEAVPHAGHIDYLVAGHLHSPCQSHCDDHGALKVA